MNIQTIATCTVALTLGHNSAHRNHNRNVVTTQYNGIYVNRASPKQWHAFLATPTQYSRIRNKLELHAGWGRTYDYTWNEDGHNVQVSVSLEPGLSTSDLEVTIQPNTINAVNKRKPKKPLISGTLKGPIDVDGSFWTVEEIHKTKHLIITLKKSELQTGFWFGVLKDEKIEQQTYETVKQQDVKVTKVQSKEPKGIFAQYIFEEVDQNQLEEILKRWMSRESSDKMPYGKPKLPINITFIPEGAGGKLIYESKHPDIDEYLDVIVGPIDTKEKKYTGEGAQVTFINSPSTKIIQGQLGNEIADLTVTSLNTLLQNFERDVHKLDGLIKNRNSAKDTFDYMGSSAFIDTENLEPYIKYHEQIKEQTKGSRLEPDPKKVFRDEATGVVIDWNKTSDDPTVSKEEDEKNKKVLLNTLTEAIKRTKRPQPEETIKDMVNNVKQALSLNNIEYDQIMMKAKERISQEASMIEQQQKSVSKMKSFAQLEGVDGLIESSKPDLTSETPDNSFDVAMAIPDSSMLAKKYASISSTQKEQLRKRWKSNEKRLKLLIAELIEAPQNKCPTICNNYIDLLISEDYPTLMKSYIRYNAIQNEQEKNRLTFLNEFVISLYKDQAIYLLHDEHLQLQKIEEIIQWALEDFQNLNDLLEENKHKYDANFVSYLNLAISKEVERIKKEHGNTPLPEATAKSYEHPWLCLLTIIQRAIYSMAEADMAEDCYILTTIINFKDPLVRSYMLELFLATMPRSDWKAFKDLIMSASNSLINKPPEERTDLKGTEPHFVEAVMQLREEVEKMIPDWIIDELLSEDDRMYMIENNKRKSPLMQLQLEPKESTPDAAQKPKEKEIYIGKQTVSVKK